MICTSRTLTSSLTPTPASMTPTLRGSQGRGVESHQPQAVQEEGQTRRHAASLPTAPGQVRVGQVLPGLRELRQREWEFLCLYGLDKLVTILPKWLDLSHDILWVIGPWTSLEMPTVTAGGLVWDPRLMRTVRGLEKLAAQEI